MKKIFAGILSVMLVMSLSACGNSDSESTAENTSETDTAAQNAPQTSAGRTPTAEFAVNMMTRLCRISNLPQPQ